MTAVRIGVAAFLVAVMTACGSSTSTPTPTTPTPTTPAAVTVTILSAARTLGVAAYVPNPVMVAVGAKLTWSNTDSTTHDMVSDTGVWDSRPRGLSRITARYIQEWSGRSSFSRGAGRTSPPVRTSTSRQLPAVVEEDLTEARPIVTFQLSLEDFEARSEALGVGEPFGLLGPIRSPHDQHEVV
jgi:plastocyanin